MLIAKYEFDNTMYDLIPEFNSGYTGYTYTDKINDNITIRTIECDTLPTKISFNNQTGLLKVIDLDTSNINSMAYMFNGCVSLKEVNSTNWNTSKVTSMYYTFNHCKALKSIDTSNWNTENVESMQATFINCDALTFLDLSNWNVGNVTNMTCMFQNCSQLASLDVSNWDTSKVINMAYMFNGCKVLKSIDTSNWNTENVEAMYGMFYNCSNLESIDVSKFDTSKVTNMSTVFYNCAKLTELDVSNWNTNSVITMDSLFSGCRSITELNMENWNTSNVTNMVRMFHECQNLKSLNINHFDTSKVTNMSWMFNNCYSLVELNINSWNTGNVTVMDAMFSNCINLILINLNNWDVRKVIDMYRMFMNCKSLSSVNISNWNTEKLSNIDSMFITCSNLSSIDISNWKTDNVTKMNYIFNTCSNLEVLDLSNWKINDTVTALDILYNTKITDIGLLYSDKFTIEKIASLVPVTRNVTIWVKNIPASELDNTNYPHVTFKDYIEDIKTYNITEPLRGINENIRDRFVYKDDKLMIERNCRGFIFNGSEDWTRPTQSYIRETTIMFRYRRNDVYNNITNEQNAINTPIVSDKFITINASKVWGNNDYDSEGISMGTLKGDGIDIRIKTNKLISPDAEGFKQWLLENPINVICRSNAPIYEEIDDSIMNGYVNGKILVETDLPTNKISFEGTIKTLKYLYPNTEYLVSFESNKDTIASITLGGTELKNQSIVTGYNKIKITTPATLANSLIKIDALDTIIKEIVVTEYDENINSYFKGLKNNFDSNIITADMVYGNDDLVPYLGKYKVDIKITGKNKLDERTLSSDVYLDMRTIEFKNNKVTVVNHKNYSFARADIGHITLNKGSYVLSIQNLNNPNDIYNCVGLLYPDKNILAEVKTGTNQPKNVSFVVNEKTEFGINLNVLGENIGEVSYNLQIEENTEATEYEPYQESSQTIYLNSPLLEGDSIEVISDKLCHIKRSHMITWTGNEEYLMYRNDNNFDIISVRIRHHSSTETSPDKNEMLSLYPKYNSSKAWDKVIFTTDKFKPMEFYATYTGTNEEHISLENSVNQNTVVTIKKSKLEENTIEGFKQWLSENPITIVYELAEPIIEEIDISKELKVPKNASILIDDIVPLEKISFKGHSEEIKTLKPNTQYTLRFESNATGTLKVILGGTEIIINDVLIGQNEVLITTSDGDLFNNNFSINTIDTYNIKVGKICITETSLEPSIWNGYFKGIKSVAEFEDNKIIVYCCNSPIRFG